MKKTIYILAILVGGIVTAQKKVDVKASYGTSSLYGNAVSLTGSIISTISNGGNEVANYDSNGVFALDVMLHSNSSKWTYGVGYNMETVKDDALNFKGNFNTLLAQAQYYWLNPESKFKLYSGLGVGALISSSDYNSSKESDVIFAFNVSPIAIGYGEKFMVFLETNVGTKGYLQGGVSYTF